MDSQFNFLAPDNLKGAGMLMYEIFSSLGLKVNFRPVAKDLGYTSYEWGKPLPVIGAGLESQVWDKLEDYHEASCSEWAGRPNSPSYIDFSVVHWLRQFALLLPLCGGLLLPRHSSCSRIAPNTPGILYWRINS